MEVSSTIFKSLVWCDLGLNPGLPSHWRTLYSLNQRAGNISIVYVYRELYVKTVLFQTIQFSISTQFSSIWPIEKTLSGGTTPGQSGPQIDGTEEVHCIPQSSGITGTSPSDCLVSYTGCSLEDLTLQLRSSWCPLQPHLTGELTLVLEPLRKRILFLIIKIHAWKN